MTRPVRVIDTGVQEARLNIAFDQALVELHRAGAIADTIRFLQFPPCALVGRHQVLARELQLDACAELGLQVGRRITGGGALYLDQGQIGWELVCRRQMFTGLDLSSIAERICVAAAEGIARVGVAARFRPRNDIEVDGRKISGSGGFFDGDTLFYQGTLLICFDTSRMARVLNVPAAKLARHGATEAAKRVTSLGELLGARLPSVAETKRAVLAGLTQGLGLDPQPAEVSAMEWTEARKIRDAEVGRDDFVDLIRPPEGADTTHSGLDTPGGRIEAHLRLEGPRSALIREALFVGDFFVAPPRLVFDLESTLRGRRLDEAAAVCDNFLDRSAIATMSLPRDAFAKVLAMAAER